MLNKLRGAFTRARIRHPRKAIAGSAATLNGAALALIPFDGGATFLITSGSSIVGGIMGTVIDICELDHSEHKRKSTISHLGKRYLGTEAEANAYNRLTHKINVYKRRFNNTLKDKDKRRILKKAQKLADMQQWIVDGLKTSDEQQSSNLEFKIEYGAERKRHKVGNN